MEAGNKIETVVNAVIYDLEKRTRDLGGNVNTDRFGGFVAVVTDSSIVLYLRYYLRIYHY